MPDPAGERVSVAWERVVGVDGGCRIRARVTFAVRGDTGYAWAVEKLGAGNAGGERIAGGASRKRTEAIAAAAIALSEALTDARRGERLGEGIVVFGSPGGPERDRRSVTEGSDQPADVRTRTVETGVVLEADDAATSLSRKPRTR